MNDYWNDPPDDAEIPSKCPYCGSNDTVIVTLNNLLACENCNAIIEPEPEPYDGWDTQEEKKMDLEDGDIIDNRISSDRSEL